MEREEISFKEEFSCWNTKLMDFSRGKSTTHSNKESLTEALITLAFLTKKKIRLLNFKKKFRISRNDLEEPQRGKINWRMKLFD
jgi:hypothetical protein